MASQIEATPRFFTERNPARSTTGGQVAKIGRLLDSRGRPFMPWQRMLADVAGEIDTTSGFPWYRRIIVIVPRQAGKTTEVRAQATHACLVFERVKIRYTAQTRLMAAARLEQDFYEPIKASPLNALLNHRIGSRRRGQPGFSAKPGAEAIHFGNGSIWGVDAVKDESGHGPSLRRGFIDEAFAHQDARVEQAMGPAMIADPEAQLWVTSAAGTWKSKYLRSQVDAARSRAEVEANRPLHERSSRTLFLEYSAPEDADRDDPATWLGCHPAIGHTIRLEDIAAEHEAWAHKPEEFDRAYLGWWPERSAAEWVIPEGVWSENAAEPDQTVWHGEPVWSIDVAPTRDAASIGMAGRALEGRVFVDVADTRLGPPTWCVDRLGELRSRWGGTHVGLIDAARSLRDDLESAGFTVHLLSASDRMDACGGFYDDAHDHKLRHVHDPDLDGALASAAKRFMTQEGGFVWTRGRSLMDITPLYAATVARFVWLRVAPPDYETGDSLG